MELLSGVTKEDYSDYILYFIETLSDELKEEIRNRLVAICYGIDQAQSTRRIYSYRATVEEFIKRYKTSSVSEDRKKGMIGELLVHVLLDIEGRFIAASPFFNMEERSFKKGFDVALFDENTNELWIAEVKSGKKQLRQPTASSAIVGLINTAKNDLDKRLNDENTSLWLNAINAAKLSMSGSGQQKNAVVKLLEQYADDAVESNSSSQEFKYQDNVENVLLSQTKIDSSNEEELRQASEFIENYENGIIENYQERYTETDIGKACIMNGISEIDHL